MLPWNPTWFSVYHGQRDSAVQLNFIDLSLKQILDTEHHTIEIFLLFEPDAYWWNILMDQESPVLTLLFNVLYEKN